MVWCVPGSDNVLLELSEQKRTENNLSQEKSGDRLNIGRSLEIVIYLMEKLTLWFKNLNHFKLFKNYLKF